MLSERAGAVLKTLIEEYIDTAVPVASESIARKSSSKVSSATVRNEMAELEEGGYIIRPHISAGGVPSSKGYRFYVETLDEGLEPSAGVQFQIRSRFGQVERDMDAWVKLAAGILSSLSDNMAIVTFPKAALARLKYLQLVQLQEFLAVLVIVLQEARLRHHLLPLAEPYSQDGLTAVGNKLNAAFGGLNYEEISAKSIELTPFEKTVRQDTLNMLKNRDQEANVDHNVDGLRLLLAKPEFAQKEKVQEIVEILEERMLVKSILSETPEAGHVAVHIGEENAEETLRPFSVILCQYGIPEEASGVIGAIGPTRIEYPNAIGGVKFLSSLMSDLVTLIHNKS